MINLSDINLSFNGNNHIAMVGKRSFKIDPILKSVIMYIQQNIAPKEAIKRVSLQYDLMPEELSKTVDLFLSEINRPTKTRDSYIHLRLSICPKKLVLFLSSILRPLYNKRVFSYICIIGLIINSLFIINDGLHKNIDFFNSTQLAALYFLCLLFIFIHEIGHATASNYFGCTTSTIGFGLYIFLPVLYTDVSKIWMLDKQKRIIVNLGGIYFQLIINLLLITAYTFVNTIESREWLTYLITSNSIVIITSLLPFFRNDGYWILCDLLSINNLLRKSDEWFANFITSKEYIFDAKLALFSIANQLFRLWIFIKIWDSFIDLILNLYHNFSIQTITNSIISGIFLILGIWFISKSLIVKIHKLCITK